MLSADVLLSWRIALGHLNTLSQGSFNEVIPLCAAIQCITPVSFIELLKLLWLFVMLLHLISCIIDGISLICSKAQLVFSQANLHQQRTELLQLLDPRQRVGTTSILKGWMVSCTGLFSCQGYVSWYGCHYVVTCLWITVICLILIWVMLARLDHLFLRTRSILSDVGEAEGNRFTRALAE